MGISKVDPTLSLEKLKGSPESQYFDRKSGRIAARDLAHHLSAFANASGGLIIVGMEDDATLTGVTPEQENTLRQAVFDHLQTLPAYQVESVSLPDCNDHSVSVLLFHISPSANEIIKMKNGDAYLRVGDSSRKLSAEMLASLEYSKGIKSFEARIVEDAALEDLDPDLIQQYTALLSPAISTPLDVLKGRGLIREKNGVFLITVAAILLFGKRPSQFLPGARVRFLRYEIW